MFLAARFILGMGIPFALSGKSMKPTRISEMLIGLFLGGSQLIGELAYHKERAVLTSAFNVSW